MINNILKAVQTYGGKEINKHYNSYLRLGFSWLVLLLQAMGTCLQTRISVHQALPWEKKGTTQSQELLVAWKEGTEPGDYRRHCSGSVQAESDLSLELLQELLSNIPCVLPFKNAFKYLCAFTFLENSRDNHIYRKPEDLKLSPPSCWILRVESQGVSFLCLQV